MLDVQTLIASMDRGESPRLQFFYSRSFPFSQWWAEPFEADGVTYPTAEHYMMAEKARLFGDESTRQAILANPDPAAAKRLGRAVRGFDEAAWEKARVPVVVKGNLAKFGPNPTLRRLLLETAPRVLAEASPSDLVWGIGLLETDPRASDPRRWRGQNLLGFALMRVRDLLGGAA